jgi:zinc protease
MLKKILSPIAFCVSSLFVLSVATAAPKTSVLPIKNWQLANGAQVYYVHLSEVPMVDISVVFDAGSARDGESFGLAKFTNGGFCEGTGNLNADDIAEQFASLGVVVDNKVSRDMSILHLRSLTKPELLTPAVNLFSQLIIAPKLPVKNYERIKNQMLQDIKQQDETPSSIAAVALFKKIYGNTPYGHSTQGTVNTVSKITPQQIAAFYHHYYVGRNAIITIVGDVDEQQARNIASTTFGQLPAGNAAEPIPAVTNITAAQTVAIDYPSNQSALKLGQLGIEWSNPNFFNLAVGNYILGGGSLTSQLFLEVRQKRGLTYSVDSNFYPLKEKGPFIIELQTKNEDRQKALQVINDVLHRFLTQGPTEDELAMAKKHIIGNFPLTIDSNKAISAKLIMIAFYHLPSDYLDTYRQRINQVTTNEVKTAFQQTIKPDQLITVIVGPAMETKQDAKKT